MSKKSIFQKELTVLVNDPKNWSRTTMSDFNKNRIIRNPSFLVKLKFIIRSLFN